jgi:outer membrane protein OmpA-like peptidoglycan-associated protein
MKKAALILSLICYSAVSFAQETEKVIVHFRFNKFELDESEKKKIDSAFSDKSVATIHIDAHCDSIGDDTYNVNLSTHRAFVVKSYLESKNITSDTLEFSAYGRAMPLNNNVTEEERALNRRAEITFTTHAAAAEIAAPDKAIMKEETAEDSDTATINGTAIFSAINIENSDTGTTLRLPNLNFYGNEHILLPNAQQTLQLLLITLRENPKLEIEIQGHICCKQDGSDGFDWGSKDRHLSVNRAKAIREYLIGNGIEARRLSYKGFGSSHKLVPEVSDYYRMLNRRVEIKIVKK